MLKRTFKIIGILLVLLIAVVLFNTFTYKSKQLQVQAVAPAPIPDNCAQHLSEAVKIKTVSHDDASKIDPLPFVQLLAYLTKTYPLADSLLKKEIINNYSLLYKWEGEDASLKPIVLMGHMDVVPVDDEQSKNWEFDPFGGEIKNGFICGRGTLDDKVNVIGILETVEMLLKENFRPKRTIYLAFGHDEEVGGENGAKKIAEHLESLKVEAEFILDEGMVITKGIVPGIEPDVALIGISEKGYLTVELSVETEGGHSSMPAKATPIGILSAAVAKLEQSPMQATISKPVQHFLDYVGPEMPFLSKLAFANQWLLKGVIIGKYEASNSGSATVRTTTAPTIFKSGFKENVLPQIATATINFRILPGETAEGILKHIENTVNDSRVKIHKPLYSNEAAPVSDIESTGFKSLEKSIREVFNTTLVAPSLMLGATDTKHYSKISNNRFRFLPVTFDSEDLKRLHGNNEKISVEAFKNCIRLYRQLIINSCGQ
ncbi:MAG: M20 family peptidase [Bacteroidia bacterium]